MSHQIRLLVDGLPVAIDSKAQCRYATSAHYTDRSGKARYIAEKYAAILQGGVLDSGCLMRV